MNAMDTENVDSMEGVLGIRSYVPKSKDVENFTMRLKRNLLSMKPNISVSEISIFCLWAYDTIWALAMAVEKIELTNSSFLNTRTNTSTDFERLGTSEIGPRLLSEILNTKFNGLSGEFHLVNGQLKTTSPFEIINVIAGKGVRVVGFWTPDKRLTKKLVSTSSSNGLKKIIWPGDSTTIPKGWAIPNLKVGIPVKEGFKQFVKMHKDRHTNETTFSGFCIDVFRAVLNALDFKISYEFVPFMNDTGGMNGTYDDLLQQIEEKKVHAVVGDTTIVTNRTYYVDFTLPYSESGVTMLVPVKHDKSKTIWIFFQQPWSLDLWLTAIATCIFIGLVLRILEHRNNNTELGGPLNRQLGMILCLPFYALTLPEKELVAKGSSRFVLVIWLCAAYILMQSYTASLSSVLTVDKLKPKIVSVKELQSKGYYVGYQSDSFVKDLLVQQLKFNETKLRHYGKVQEYHEALSKGSENGGVAAIFDEVPYIRVFLANKKYSSNYMMAGPTYRTDGFGFAFPRDSPLVSSFSRAILRVMEQGNIMDNIEKQYFGHKIISLDLTPPISTDNSSLDAYSFGGLFIIVGTLSLLALLISESYIWQKPAVALAQIFSKTFPSSQPSNGNKSEIQIAQMDHVGGDSSEVEGSGNIQRISAKENEAENVDAEPS
ncbi:glutamate receptor 2.8-like [Pistacia vera]|uniref:glutamate receptor 2.8-like n=1 Tax=Pistacia vera TaxID=55513 RepID=UPI00126370B7|nr:glutamate receptor 2.8-like [Pistacia vera]